MVNLYFKKESTIDSNKVDKELDKLRNVNTIQLIRKIWESNAFRIH